MKIQQFDGGLSTRQRPQFLQTNQGVVYENIDNDAGTLAPLDGLLPTTKSIKPYYTYYNALHSWIDFDMKTDYLEYQGDMYFSDGFTRPQKFNGKAYTNLGIEVPDNTMQFEVVEAPESPKEFTVKVNTKADGSGFLPRAVYSYLLLTEDGERSKATYVQVRSDNEVLTLGEDLQQLPRPTAIVTDPAEDEQEIKFSGYPNDTVPMKIYRYYDKKWYYVTEISKDDTFIDKTLDISGNNYLAEDALPALTGVVSYVLTYYNEKDGTESGPSDVSDEIDLEESYGSIKITKIPSSDDPQVTHKRLYRIGNNLARFTLITELDKDEDSFFDNVSDSKTKLEFLPAVNAEPAPKGLKHLTAAYGMIFGTIGEKLLFTPVGVPYSWPASYFISYDAEITGLATAANGLLVFTKYQTHIVIGTSPSTLSTYLLSGDQGCISSDSIQMLGSEAVWVSTDGVCRSSGGRPLVMTKNILGKVSIDAVDSAVHDEVYYVLDSSGKMYAIGDSIVKILDVGVDSIAVAEDTLYGRKDGVLNKFFLSDSKLTFKYKSPIYTEGSFTEDKVYKKVFIYSSGYVKINILIDGHSVASKEFTKEDNNVILIPAELQRGNYIQFEIEGTGEVYEIEYTAIGQQKR